MGWAYSTLGKSRDAFRMLVGKSKMGNLSIDGRIILKWILEKHCVRFANSIRVSDCSVHWRYFMSTVMNPRVP